MVVGLTGQTGAGKSTVSSIWKVVPGVRVIDADRVARQVTEEETHLLADLALEFSTAILTAEGTLNRKKLGEQVFGDRRKLRRLNAIIFPYILTRLREEIAALEGAGVPLIILDAPTLFESGANELCHRVVSVIAPAELRLERILARDGISREEALDRMASQHVDEYYTGRSQYVIENAGDGEALATRAKGVLEALKATADSDPPGAERA